MKKTITITLHTEVDGRYPDNEEPIHQALADIVPSIIASEAADGTDRWALLIDNLNTQIL